MEKRELLDQLGRSYEMLRTAHYSIRAALRDRKPLYVGFAVQQWAAAVEEYTEALEAILKPPPPSPPAKPLTPEQEALMAVERVQSRVLGRIVKGRFVPNEES